MAESRMSYDQIDYIGIYPTVFKKIESSDVKINKFQVYKTWHVISGSATSSALPLVGIYSDTNILPVLGTSLTYNDSSNIDGSLQTIAYFSINHQYFKYKNFPALTYGPTDLNRTKKHLYQSASILSFPQIRIGEGIKHSTFMLTASFNSGSIYGSSSYGTGSYLTISPLYIKSDRYGNLHDIAFNTASIVNKNTFYEGFNEYFDTTRITYESSNVTYVNGINTTTGLQQPIGLSAQFDGNGYIRTKLDGAYNRQTNYAVSFFLSGANNTSNNELIVAKASSSLAPQYPFSIELSGSNQLVYKIAGSTEFQSVLTSSIVADIWTHVVCQKSGSNMQLYVNGALHASASNNLLSLITSPFTASARIDNTADLFIGGFNDTSMNLQGKLDEIRVYNKALSAVEIGYLADRTEAGTFLQTNHVGNIFTKQGIAVVSSPDYRFKDVIYLPYSASYKSTVTLYELNVIANVDAGDFNMSSNLTLTGDDDSTYQSFVSSSVFAPYITTIGLYDNAGQLLAIGKLAQPIQTRSDVDMNFLIRLDLDRNIS